MERKPFITERCQFIWREMFTGNWELFQKVLGNPETIIVYDIDGILIDTPKIVLNKFTEKTGIRTNPVDIDKWNYLSELAENSGLSKDVIEHANDDWFRPEVLARAHRYLYIKSLVQKTVNYYGPQRNFVLTSRNPYFKLSTINHFSYELPEIKSENIFIRDNGGVDMTVAANFKTEKIRDLAIKAPWVFFVDDSPDFSEAVLRDGPENCLVINIPLGKTKPTLPHERLIVIKRFPEDLQAMYPLKFMVDKAIDSTSNK